MGVCLAEESGSPRRARSRLYSNTELEVEASQGHDGLPIATYDQETVKGFARVFTGWSYAGGNTNDPDEFYWPPKNYRSPMAAWPSHHSVGTKKLRRRLDRAVEELGLGEWRDEGADVGEDRELVLREEALQAGCGRWRPQVWPLLTSGVMGGAEACGRARRPRPAAYWVYSVPRRGTSRLLPSLPP